MTDMEVSQTTPRKQRPDTKFDVIIYHSPCSDGTAAAWAIWSMNKNAQLIPARYGGSFPEDSAVKDKSVAIVDFSYSRENLTKLSTLASRVVLLDHHKSAERDLKDLVLPNTTIIFDMKRSGAQLAWDYMFPTVDGGPARHWAIEMVADRDLWTWKLWWSKAVGKATYEQGYHESVEKFDNLISQNEKNNGFEKFVETGNLLVSIEEKELKSQAEHAIIGTLSIPNEDGQIDKYLVAVCNPQWSMRSEVGNVAANMYPFVDFVIMYNYIFLRDEWWLSFRAGDKSLTDLSIISKMMPNGGGHPKAAGATIYGPLSEPPKHSITGLPLFEKGKTLRDYLTPLPKEQVDFLLDREVVKKELSSITYSK